MKCRLFLSMAVLIWVTVFDGAFRAGFPEVLAEFQNGSIDWSSGVVEASGLGGPCKRLPDGSRQEEEAMAEACAGARKNLLRIVERIRIDSHKTVGDLLERDPEARKRLLTLIDSIQPLMTPGIRSDDFAEVKLSMSIHGSFSQIVLPSEIKQIDPIRPVSPMRPPPAFPASEPPSGKSPVHSGMIVDAKGLVEVKPAMVPQIVDEAGNQIYGPAFVSREYAVESGMSVYMQEIQMAKTSSRVEPNPLIVKGLKTENDGRSIIVVSNADASKLRHASEHFSFLKQCRVIIVVD
jgi:hypothetical protein